MFKNISKKEKYLQDKKTMLDMCGRVSVKATHIIFPSQTMNSDQDEKYYVGLYFFD